jgi:hypothetical protein
MARTSAEAVKALLLSDYDAEVSPSLAPFITSANLLTTRLASYAVAAGDPFSSDELAAIEGWLAAHFYVMSDQNVASETNLSASATYQGQTGKRLEASKYGQAALTLDTTGFLGGSAAGGFWLGKTRAEQIDYADRVE